MTAKNHLSHKRSTSHQLVALPVVLAALAASVACTGCDSIENPAAALCCEEGDFQVGGTISGDYDAKVLGALQAVADVSGIAAATIDDLTTACRSMATGLDADQAGQDAAEATEDKRERMKAWCNLAVSTIASVKGSATLTVDIQPPKCSASVSASANCNASCQVDASCDAKATPPTCEGGKLEVSCKGGCTGKAGASVQCTGSCSAECKGECTAEGGVECSGKCEGTCKGAAEGGTGTGIKADGTCDGTCEGTCKATAPGATCTGSCKGECSATCEGSAEASVTCDGECAGEVEPLKCEGGTLKASCEADADCSANCDASVKAKAECTPPSISVKLSGSIDANASAKLKAVLEANLGLIATVKARFEAAGEAVVTLSGNVNADFLVDIKVACIPVVVAAVLNAADDLGASGEASVSVLGSVGG